MDGEALLEQLDLGDQNIGDLLSWAKGRADQILAGVNTGGNDLHTLTDRVIGQLANEVGLGEGPAMLSVPPPAPPPLYPSASDDVTEYGEPESLEFGIPDEEMDATDLVEDVYTDDVIQPRSLHESVELALGSSLNEAKPKPRRENNSVANLAFLHDDDDD